MEIRFKKQFLKDLIRIPPDKKPKIESLVFEEIPSADLETIFRILSKMRGYEAYIKSEWAIFELACASKKMY
jgi:hypothetical protein